MNLKLALPISLITLMLLSCKDNQKTSSDVHMTMHPVNDSLNLWLTDGSHRVDIMSGYTNKDRMNELFATMREASERDPAAYLSVFEMELENVADSTFERVVGLTKADLQELTDLSNNLVFSSDTIEVIHITRHHNEISFYTKGRHSAVLNLLSYSGSDQTFTLKIPGYEEQILHFADEVSVPKTENGLQHAWHGYEWVSEIGVSPEQYAASESTEPYNYSRVVLNVGVLDNGRTWLWMGFKRFENNVKVADNSLPILFID